MAFGDNEFSERKLRASRGCPATCGFGAGKRFIHDAADGARTAPALGAATEAVIDLSGGAWDVLAGRHRRAHVAIREHVAGTHNHCRRASGKLVPSWSQNWSQDWSNLKLSIAEASDACKAKIVFYRRSNL